LTPTTQTQVEFAKYAPDNTALWTRDFDAIGPLMGRRLAVDATGVFFITGNPVALYNNAPVVAHKWSTAGVELWTHPLRNRDFARDLAADGTGFYLMAMDLQAERTVVRRYDSVGSELWSRTIDPEPDVNLSLITADGTGVYVG